MTPAVKILEGRYEDGTVGQGCRRSEAERQLECRHCLRFGLVGLTVQLGCAIHPGLMRGDKCPLFAQRWQWNSETCKRLGCNPLASARTAGFRVECREEAASPQHQLDEFTVEAVRFRYEDRELRRDHCLGDRLWQNANRSITCIDPGENDVARIGGEHATLVGSGPDACRYCPVQMHRDRRPDAERSRDDNPLQSSSNNIANRRKREARTAFLGSFSNDPGFERPPPPDQAAEGRRKSGASSGLAPASTHDSNARQASTSCGRSSGTFSPVSPVEVIPTAAGAATKTG